MMTNGTINGARRLVLDALLGLALFLLVSGLFVQDIPAEAHGSPGFFAIDAADAGLPPRLLIDLPEFAPSFFEPSALASFGGVNQGFRLPDRQTAFFTLAAVFSMLFAINLAFWRHVRRTYAAPRRGG